MYRPLTRNLLRDNIRRTTDYALVIAQVRAYAAKRTFTLVETIAEDIANLILKKHAVDGVTVRLGKKVFPGVGAVGAEVTRVQKSVRS
jgi:dihydroneopterin aldolase